MKKKKRLKAGTESYDISQPTIKNVCFPLAVSRI